MDVSLLTAAVYVYGAILAAKGAAVVATDGSSIDYSKTINLGAVLVGLLVVAVAGLFTIRSNVAKIWRENAEGEKEARIAAEAEAKDQREQKHAIKNEMAALKLRLESELATEKMKTDLQPLAELAHSLTGDLLAAANVTADQIIAKVTAAIDESTDRIIRELKT